MVAALEADQGLTADLLRYAYSAACARPPRARSIRAAVTLVGRRAIAQLALEAATYRFFQRAPGNGWRSIGHLHLHAAAVAGPRRRSPSGPAQPRTSRISAACCMTSASSCCRSPARRLGGDEFAVWVPGAPGRGDETADAVLHSVATAFEHERERLEVNVSIGVASPGVETDTLSTVLSRADEALYEAKRAGRGRAVRY